MADNMIRFLVLCLVFLSFESGAQVTAQWRGPERTGIYPAGNRSAQWPENGPKMLWSIEGIGNGYSSAVADNDNIFVTGLKGSQDMMTCLSMDGKIRWQTPFGPAWKGSFPETRTTPTVDGNRVYAISGGGTIACLDTSSGKILWSLDGIATFQGVCGTWGVCESPLIHGDQIIYTPAGSKTLMVSLDKLSGKTTWMSETLNDTSAYVSPLLVKQGGKEIIVTLAERWFFGVDASNGRIL